jgi:hypothetical protein
MVVAAVPAIGDGPGGLDCVVDPVDRLAQFSGEGATSLGSSFG